MALKKFGLIARLLVSRVSSHFLTRITMFTLADFVLSTAILLLVETLGYGTLLIVDGFNSDFENLTNVVTIETCLREVAGLLESTQPELLNLETPSGNSATLRLAESHVSLHTFSDSSSLCLRVFSRHDVRPGEITDLLEKHFSVRRVESYLSNHSRTMPSDSESRQRALLGDRNYCALRLAPAF